MSATRICLRLLVLGALGSALAACPASNYLTHVEQLVNGESTESRLSPAKAITAFSFTSPAATGVVTEATHTVAITVPSGTPVTALVPSVTITGPSVSPPSGSARDFTNPVVYTVKAADSSTQAYTVTVTVATSSSKAITAFNVTSPAAAGVVTEATHAVAITVPFGTPVTALVPTIAITGASINPLPGTPQNFTSPVVYTVFAADSSAQPYTVTVTVAPNPAKAITAFNFTSPAATGVVTEAAHTVAITVPFGTPVSTLVPTIAIAGASVSPLSGTPQNFTSPVVYTVTAADSSTQPYTVTVTVAPDPAKAITAFTFTSPAATGVVTEATHTVAITVPFGTSVTALVPTIAFAGASVSPLSGTPQNFTSPVVYTVTAADSSTQPYTVTVTVAPNPAKAITAFDFTSPAATGTVTEATHTVAITVPYGTPVTALVPTIAITGASVSPLSGTPQNFTSPVVYTVTAADSSTQPYTVTVTVSPLFRISAAAYGGQVWSSADGGATWVASGPTLNWTNLCGSADGTKLIANAGAYAANSSIYRSTDGGATWNPLSTAGSHAFAGMGSSDDGTILGATVYDGTQLFYYSKDSGTTWSTAATAGGQWWGNASSSTDGLKWIACNGGDSSSNVYIWAATFDGVSSWTWTKTAKGYLSEGASYPVDKTSITKDGSTFFIAFPSTAYLSSNFGATWSSLPTLPGTPITASRISGNGAKLVLVVNNTTLFTSTNGGVSWNPASGTPGSPNVLTRLAISYDGSRIAFIAQNSGANYLYISTDGGVSFVKQTGPGLGGMANWYDLFMQLQ